MMNEVLDFAFTLNPDAVSSLNDSGIVILHTGQGRIFSSNKTGALIWQGLEHRRSLAGIVEEISGEFQIPETTARRHTLNFLTALEQQSLIKSEVVS